MRAGSSFLPHRAGIDEAGYGPLLGPLVIGLTAFEAPSEHSLWTLLAAAVSEGKSRGKRLTVCDSKVLKQGTSGLAALETTALAFVSWRLGHLPRTLAEMLDGCAIGRDPGPAAATHPTPLALARTYPWYRDGLERINLPIAADATTIEMHTVQLAAAARAAGVAIRGLFVRPVFEDEFNRDSAACASKASVLFHGNIDLLLALRRGVRGSLRVVCDRHGGRSRYRAPLALAFPFEPVAVVSESRDASRYHVGREDSFLEIEYCVGGERASFEVALASILAKYTRELCMAALNRHFLERAPGLAPTAGYWADGQRFVADLTARGALDESTRARLLRQR